MKQIWLLLFSVALSGCAQSVSENVPSINSLSLRLAQHDSEDQVIKKLGYSPTKVEFSACGPANNIPCRIMYYEWGGKTLMVILVSNRVLKSFKVPFDQLPKDPNLLNSTHAHFESRWMVGNWSVF
jgi:hypothetical protein